MAAILVGICIPRPPIWLAGAISFCLAIAQGLPPYDCWKRVEPDHILQRLQPSPNIWNGMHEKALFTGQTTGEDSMSLPY